MEPVGKGVFAGAFPVGNLKFVCTDDSECNALSIDDGRVQKLRLVRVAITPVGTKPQG